MKVYLIFIEKQIVWCKRQEPVLLPKPLQFKLQMSKMSPEVRKILYSISSY